MLETRTGCLVEYADVSDQALLVLGVVDCDLKEADIPAPSVQFFNWQEFVTGFLVVNERLDISSNFVSFRRKR